VSIHVDHFTHDHALVVHAAYAMRTEQPMYADTLLREARDPLHAAVELVGMLMAERAEALKGDAE